MRADKLQARLAAGIFGFLGAFGGIGSIVTGMRFEGVSMVTVAILCVITAAVCSSLVGRKSFLAVPAVLVFIILRLWYVGSLNLSAEAFLYHITHLYDMGYGWGTIRWSGEHLSTDMAQPALCLLGVLITIGIVWSFFKCKGIWLTSILTAAPVIPCMLLTDTVPSAFYLFVQLLCLVLLFMIRLAKKKKQAIALLKLLALPVAAAVLLLFLCMPQKNYTSLEQVDVMLGRVQEFFSDSSMDTPQTPVRQESNWIDLTSVGPKSDRRTPVMEVLAQQTGYLYLKGAAYDTYRGTWWDCQGITAFQPQSTARSLAVRITTNAIHDVLYLPYGAYSIASADMLDSLAEENGRVKNAGPWHSYTVRYTGVPGYEESWQLPAEDLPQQLTQLPNSTRRAAANYLARELPELDNIMGVWSKAKAIADHVSKSARYSLQTQKMPASSDDFALWFLEESNTGYCIHFASAATVLLRAAGIPARYVTGYLVNAQDSRIAEVTQGNAHAWAECYIDGAGWVPLEATPGNGVTETVGEATVPSTTQPSESAETTGTEENTEATHASGTTEPSQTQETLETTTPSRPSASPSEGTSTIGGADGPAAQPWVMPWWLKWVFGILCAIAVIIAQWRLRFNLRKQKRRRGKRNAQALARWREVTLHCRVRKEAPDEKLHALAQKARFSHHVLTREELLEFDEWINSSTEKIRRLNLLKRFLATVLFALY